MTRSTNQRLARAAALFVAVWATDTFRGDVRAAEKAGADANIAWGEAHNGVRLGLAFSAGELAVPAADTVGKRETLTLHLHNMSDREAAFLLGGPDATKDRLLVRDAQGRLLDLYRHGPIARKLTQPKRVQVGAGKVVELTCQVYLHVFRQSFAPGQRMEMPIAPLDVANSVHHRRRARIGGRLGLPDV
jgi:hypothetical protein